MMSEDSTPAKLTGLFVTEIYRTDIAQTHGRLVDHLDFACRKMAREHAEGRAWSEKHGYIGYTSYGTIKELSTYAPVFAELKTILDRHAELYAERMDMDLAGKSLVMQDSWINVLGPLGGHASHFHAQSVISGTFYVSIPPGTSVISFEDPRLVMMMHAPARHKTTRQDRQAIVPVVPARGALLLWESWLRHEVAVNRTSEPRVSISFNYDLA